MGRAVLIFFKCLFSGNNDVSSKRFVTVSCSMTLIFVIIVNLFTHLVPADILVNSLSYVIMLGLGAVASERFSKKPDSPSNEK